MLRYGTNPVILLINNGGYTIEVEVRPALFPYFVCVRASFCWWCICLCKGMVALFPMCFERLEGAAIEVEVRPQRLGAVRC